LEPFTQHLILFSQVPVLPYGQTVNLREFVNARLKLTGSIPRLLPDRKDSLRKSINAQIQILAEEFPKIQLFRADEPFYRPDGTIKFIEGRNCLYFDDDHLSQAGAELLRDSFTRTLRSIISDSRTE
jgi:hypothetical protein